MRKFGLIGYPLSHSFSAGYFAEKFRREGIQDAVYDNYPIKDISEIKTLFHDKNLLGLNVTIPYKELVLPYLDEIDATAQEIGAVNTIRIFQQHSGLHLKGYNTDIWGFEKSLDQLLGSQTPKAYLLGTGGASKAVEWVFQKRGIEYIIISRTSAPGRITYNDLKKKDTNDYKLWVNTSPVGMFPQTEVAPEMPYPILNKEYFLFDLIYNPTETLFLRKGREAGAATMNGLEMLKLQAEKAWEIWNNI